MKKIIFTLDILFTRYCLVLAITAMVLAPHLSFSQTNFYNGGTDVTINSAGILYVDGHVTNFTTGAIHNQGNLYLTGNWSNDASSGCLDPTTGKVILYGASQMITGAATTTFNDLDCQGIGTKKLNVTTVVGGNSGVLALESDPFNLNSKTCIVTNPAPAAITRTTGYIISETDPTAGYGKVQWNIGNSASNYVIPFGTAAGTYIPVMYNVTAAGTGAGSVSVATYPTDVTAAVNNRPLPSGVTDLNDANGLESADKCADRFWDVNYANYTANPAGDLTFTYRDIEWNTTGGSTNNIIEDSLRAWMWNGTQWQNPTVGTLNSTMNTITITANSVSAPWTLKMRDPNLNLICGNLAVPNAFSPNNDGHSDLFLIHGWSDCVADFSILIFDRWGEKVYETDDVKAGWDGTYKGKALEPAVFVYYINAKLLTGEKVSKKGNISLIR